MSDTLTEDKPGVRLNYLYFWEDADIFNFMCCIVPFPALMLADSCQYAFLIRENRKFTLKL